LVTDALSAIGLPDGIHHLGDKQIEVKNSKAYIANTNTLCGSVTSLDECMRYFINSTSEFKQFLFIYNSFNKRKLSLKIVVLRKQLRQ